MAVGHNENIIIITDIARKRVNVRLCTIPACNVIIKQTLIDINVYCSLEGGKFDELTLFEPLAKESLAN